MVYGKRQSWAGPPGVGFGIVDLDEGHRDCGRNVPAHEIDLAVEHGGRCFRPWRGGRGKRLPLEVRVRSGRGGVLDDGEQREQDESRNPVSGSGSPFVPFHA